jgi:hypothetical protein
LKIPPRVKMIALVSSTLAGTAQREITGSTTGGGTHVSGCGGSGRVAGRRAGGAHATSERPVTVTDDGGRRLNRTPHEMRILS